MRIVQWMGAGLGLALLSSCSTITVMRTKEFKSEISRLEGVMRGQLDSLRAQVDSLREDQKQMSLRANADAGEMSKEIGRGNDRFEARLQEVAVSIQRIEDRVQKLSLKTRKADPQMIDPASGTAPAAVDSSKLKLQAELEGLFQKGKLDFSAQKYKESYQSFYSMYNKDSVGLYQEQSLYWMARCLDELDKTDESIKLLSDLVNYFPKGSKYCASLWLKSKLLSRKKDLAEEKKTLSQLTGSDLCAGTNELGLAKSRLEEIK